MGNSKVEYSGYDYLLLVPTILLLGFGLVAIYSASSFLAAHRMGDSYYFLKRQIFFCLLGLSFLIIAKNIPVTAYRKGVYILLAISLGLLAILFIPGVGKTVGGACRWLQLPGFSFQPSELAKLCLAVYIAYSMEKKGPNMGRFSRGLLPHLIVAGIFMILILLQPDLGTAVIIGCWLLMLLFVGGISILQISLIALVSGPLIWWLIRNNDYQLKRWWAFINPWEDPQGFGFQIIHSFLAFGSGGIFGVGLGNSKQKLLYLPEPHTDFILSIVAEELGLFGLAIIIVLFSMLIIRGLKIALDAPDLYSSYLALAISSLMGLQVLINMGVVMGLLPTTGLTLPLMSYGGSSLVVNLIGIGILLSIAARR